MRASIELSSHAREQSPRLRNGVESAATRSQRDLPGGLRGKVGRRVGRGNTLERLEEIRDVLGVRGRPVRIGEKLDGEQGAIVGVGKPDEGRKKVPRHAFVDDRLTPQHLQRSLVVRLLCEDEAIRRGKTPCA
jgi:hypothetical protein